MTIEVETDLRSVEVSNPDKMLFPGTGITKADLAHYYQRIGEHMVPYLRDRAVTLHRFPDGIEAEGFIQKNASDHFPDWVQRHRLAKEDGEVEHVVVNDVATLVYLADQACITPHITLSRVDSPDHPDRMVFDLDPPEDTDDLDALHGAVRTMGDILDDLGIDKHLMTTGSKGYHIVVARDRDSDFDEVHDMARDISRRAAEEQPDLLTVEQRKDRRGDRVFVDYLRNSYAQTTVAPYAVRPIEDAPVATPLAWEELGSSEPRQFRMDNIFRRLGQKPDPWAGL